MSEHTPTPCENPAEYGPLKLYEHRVDGKFPLKASSSFPDYECTIGLITYKPHAAYIVKAVNEYAGLIDRATAAEILLSKHRVVNAELVEAIKGIIAIADRNTVEFDKAKAALARYAVVGMMIKDKIQQEDEREALEYLRKLSPTPEKFTVHSRIMFALKRLLISDEIK